MSGQRELPEDDGGAPEPASGAGQPASDDGFGDVLPDPTADERELDPSDREPDDDERIKRERPPHW